MHDTLGPEGREKREKHDEKLKTINQLPSKKISWLNFSPNHLHSFLLLTCRVKQQREQVSDVTLCILQMSSHTNQ